jgi:hypothetical protein
MWFKGWRLAKQGERLDAGIVQPVGHERIKQRLGLGDELGVDVHARDHKDLTRLRVPIGITVPVTRLPGR